MNKRGKDKLYSEPPSRAKYLWPLACVFNPYGVFKLDNESNWVCEPRDPKLEELYWLSNYFEAVHVYLDFTDVKRILRNRCLSPFYTELLNVIYGEDIIEVPLIHNPAGSLLQKIWCTLHNYFKGTLMIDEIYSMLATVALTSTQFEKRWVAQEEQHIQGFADRYIKGKKCLRLILES
jgi:hypothetical protein